MAGGRRIRTDLALETTERFAEENTEIRGVEIHEEYDEEKEEAFGRSYGERSPSLR